MSNLRITNVSGRALWLRDLYTELAPGDSAAIVRTPAEMAVMVGLQEYIAEGKVKVDIELETHEAPSELVSIWPLGLNWRPAALSFAALPNTGNVVGDIRLTVDSLTLWAWDGSAWVPFTGGGGGPPTGPAGGDLTGNYPNPQLANSGVSAGTFGSGSSVPVLTVDLKGRITSISTASNAAAHETYDTLTHAVAETNYQEFSYNADPSPKVTAITYWTSPAKTLKIREHLFSYNPDGTVATETVRQYNNANVVVAEATTAFAYNANHTLASVSTTRTL